MYMSMGMTYSEFWDQDAEMVKPLRKAFEQRRRDMNLEAWLIGSYVYEAFTVAYSNAWSKDSKLEYPAQPRPLTEADVRREREEAERLQMEKLFSYMTNKLAVQKKEAQENGRI